MPHLKTSNYRVNHLIFSNHYWQLLGHFQNWIVLAIISKERSTVYCKLKKHSLYNRINITLRTSILSLIRWKNILMSYRKRYVIIKMKEKCLHWLRKCFYWRDSQLNYIRFCMKKIKNWRISNWLSKWESKKWGD